MKKLLLATAIAALSVSAAQAAPTVYGKAFVTADYVDKEAYVFDGTNVVKEDNSTVEINSNASRIGLKGSEAMTANTDVIYQLEYGIRVDGDDRTFKSRDTYLGLANKDFGQFRAGRNFAVIDYINNVAINEGYWDNLGANTLSENDIVSSRNLTDGTRIDNSIVWIAPKYNDLPLQLALMYGADESFENSDNGFGASLMFDQGTGFTAGIGYDKDMSIGTGGDIIRGTASVDLGNYVAYPVTLGVLYQEADYDHEAGYLYDSKKEKGLVVSAEMGLTNFARPASVYLQYNKTDNLSGFSGADSDQIVLGGKYKYKDNMIAHAYIGQNSADSVARYLDSSGVYRSYDADLFAVGGGLEYIF
ncbi:porin [Psychrobacter jeotgali]|uniref:porin n=1 Tax=Psychrobacter jeotgali TaxID=179010 RepID=UPI001917AAD4|nr:porin [Psychrobacter jeotgali]